MPRPLHVGRPSAYDQEVHLFSLRKLKRWINENVLSDFVLAANFALPVELGQAPRKKNLLSARFVSTF